MIYEVQAFRQIPIKARKKDIDNLLDASDIDVWLRLQLVAQAIITSVKAYSQTGDRPDRSAGLRKLIEDKRLDKFFEEQHDTYLKPLSLEPAIPKVSILPPSSWLLHLPFTLRKPYISRDDTDFYIIDNPVKKEWVFKVPYIAPSQWKGALRSAMMQELVSNLNERLIDKNKFTDERLRLWRLFGNEKDGTSDFLNRSLARNSMEAMPEDENAKQEWKKKLEDTAKKAGKDFENDLVQKCYRKGDIEGFQGSLHFYPTYFDKIGLEVINPHDRKTGAGQNPIYFECVPAGTKGGLNLLYVPLFGPEISPDRAKEDLTDVAKGIKAMMTRYGFGAKTSSGFGVADIDKDMASVEPADFKPTWQKAWTEG